MRARLTIIILLFMAITLYSQNKVEIKKNENGYILLLNGKNFYIKGAGLGGWKSRDGKINYLKLAKEAGVNTVRTWGIDQTTQEYLDEAHKLGLFVDAGFWLNPVSADGSCSYITDKKYMKNVRKDILDYVKKYKDHPAILLWNVGNETFALTDSSLPEKEKIAFAKFLNRLIIDIKKIDPDHPTLYTSAYMNGFKYIKKYVKAIDIFGMNLYGGITGPVKSCKNLGLDIPIIITEFGPHGPWDRPKDVNGCSIEESAEVKAKLYEIYLKEIMRLKGIVLGSFVFHLGETTQESLTWWNFHYKNYKTAPFWTISKIFNKNAKIPILPKIEKIEISKYAEINPDEWIDISVEVNYPKKENLKYEYLCSTSSENILQHYVNDYVDIEISGSGPNVKIKAPDKKGIYRVYVLVYDTKEKAVIGNKSIQVN